MVATRPSFGMHLKITNMLHGFITLSIGYGLWKIIHQLIFHGRILYLWNEFILTFRVTTNNLLVMVCVRLAKIIFANLFYYSTYFYYYSWILLYFLILFMGLLILFMGPLILFQERKLSTSSLFYYTLILTIVFYINI